MVVVVVNNSWLSSVMSWKNFVAKDDVADVGLLRMLMLSVSQNPASNMSSQLNYFIGQISNFYDLDVETITTVFNACNFKPSVRLGLPSVYADKLLQVFGDDILLYAPVFGAAGADALIKSGRSFSDDDVLNLFNYRSMHPDFSMLFFVHLCENNLVGSEDVLYAFLVSLLSLYDFNTDLTSVALQALLDLPVELVSKIDKSRPALQSLFMFVCSHEVDPVLLSRVLNWLGERGFSQNGFGNVNEFYGQVIFVPEIDKVSVDAFVALRMVQHTDLTALVENDVLLQTFVNLITRANDPNVVLEFFKIATSNRLLKVFDLVDDIEADLSLTVQWLSSLPCWGEAHGLLASEFVWLFDANVLLNKMPMKFLRSSGSEVTDFVNSVLHRLAGEFGLTGLDVALQVLSSSDEVVQNLYDIVATVLRS